MSGRDRERERDRRAVAAARHNEYFLPKDGIDREVITSDICRYLGNDALVRPGNYENPVTRQSQNGYFITAYRNLTTEMIADLKADSSRWENERRATATRGPSNVGYRESNTHQSRQYYGPSEPMSGPAQGGYVSATAGPQVVYNDGPSYPQQQPLQQPNYQPPGPGYTQPGYAAASDNYYVAGANYNAAESSAARVPVSQPGVNVPRTNVSNVSYTGNPIYQQPDNRNQYYSNHQAGPPVSSGSAYPSQQPQDPYYGRGAYNYETNPPIYVEKRELSNFLAAPSTENMYAPQDPYDNRPNYQESVSYSQTQAPVSQSVPAVVPNSSSRREREREPESRDTRHGHRNSRRS